MRPVILSQADFLSKLEFDSITHVDKRTTFWCLTFDAKKQKNVENVRWYHKLYMPLESSQWAKEHELHRKLNLKNVQSRKTNFNFTNITKLWNLSEVQEVSAMGTVHKLWTIAREMRTFLKLRTFYGDVFNQRVMTISNT